MWRLIKTEKCACKLEFLKCVVATIFKPGCAVQFLKVKLIKNKVHAVFPEARDNVIYSQQATPLLLSMVLGELYSTFPSMLQYVSVSKIK